MPVPITESDIARIAEILGSDVRREGQRFRIDLRHEETGRRLAIEIHIGIALPEDVAADRPKNLVSVMGPATFHQLHACTGFKLSEELGEVIFYAKHGGMTSGLVVERSAGSSMYSNVDDRLLGRDFTQLPPEILMSSVALSLTEDLFDDI